MHVQDLVAPTGIDGVEERGLDALVAFVSQSIWAMYHYCLVDDGAYYAE